MKTNSKNRSQETEKNERVSNRQNSGTHDLDRLSKEADKERSRKPGSQSNSSKQSNNGRGGGK